jgi:hypothetical protein
MITNKNLNLALQEIKVKEHKQFTIHKKEEIRTHLISDNLIDHYGKTKWEIVDLLNNHYNQNKFNLYNWLNKNKDDEVSYFLNEVGSNSLNHSPFLAPYKFHLWLGESGFIIAIEQKGEGFNANFINQNRIKDNQGAAFTFFRNCKNQIFFDDPNNTKTVFMQQIFK